MKLFQPLNYGKKVLLIIPKNQERYYLTRKPLVIAIDRLLE